MLYFKILEDENGLWLSEREYNPKFINKTESVFVSSNGYFGVRGVHEFEGLRNDPGMFISGVFAKETEDEVNEIVNCPDIARIGLVIDGKLVSLDTVKIDFYHRRYNVYTGELRFSAVLHLDEEKQLQVETRRFASLENMHVFCHEMKVTSLNFRSASAEITTGIDGQVTNSGVSYLTDTECIVKDKKCMKYEGSAGGSRVKVFLNTVSDKAAKSQNFVLKRRSIYKKEVFELKEQETLTVMKVGYIENIGKKADETDDDIFALMQKYAEQSYEQILDLHQDKSQEFWKYKKIEIDGATMEEKAAICFAQYQLYCMTPYYTDRYSIAAKGLSGEGYKGHVFWDTELFMFPFYCYTDPAVARNLLMYRYRGLKGALRKAAEYGYEGAMYPWESAVTGEEETPLFAALNIHTGKANPVWSGRKEHHVAADIAYAVIQYYEVTNDTEFMNKHGMEMLLLISKFWVSRSTEKNGRIEILDIIGPDEYNEHIDNNAYTNYMAFYCVKETLKLYDRMEKSSPDAFESVRSKLDVNGEVAAFTDFVERIYLPQPNENDILPQDDSFLAKPELQDIEKYKKSLIKQAVLLDYSRDEVVDMQVLKQADTVMLLNLFPQLFDAELVKKNVLFYEARTLHDSSLSYCAHAQACANIGETDMGYAFFEKAMEVDLDDNPYDSTDGLHAASLGGIWNCLIQGFAGVKVKDGTLTVDPHLPKRWKGMHFWICVDGQYEKVDI